MLLLVPVSDEYVASIFALSSEQVFPEGPVYHFIVYVGLPPVQLPVKVMDWPMSIIGLEGLIVGVDRAGFIVRVFDDVNVFPTP